MFAYYVVYFLLILSSWVLSIIAWRRQPRRYWPLFALITATILVESIAAWCYVNNVAFVHYYHLFVIVDYFLLSCYFLPLASRRLKTWIRWSIVVFALASLGISYAHDFTGMPGMNINLAGLLLCVMCTFTLFDLDVKMYDSIHKHPDFWISVGILAYYCGTVFSNGMYTYLLTKDRELAMRLFSQVNQPLNLILYSCLIIGLLFALRSPVAVR
jgi:hypothetical protein